jgi:6-phosphogluconolactonase
VREALGRTAITWVVGDERCVPPDHEESNSRMITETLFRDGMSIGHSFLRFRTEIGDAAAVAGELEAQWRGQGIEGIDVALLGLGEDGHTASLFPDTPILEIDRGIAAPVFVPRLGVWRVSLTLPTLRATKSKLVLASGESKREILDRCRNGERFPITRVMEGEGEAWWLVDQKAYGD